MNGRVVAERKECQAFEGVGYFTVINFVDS